MSSGNEDHLINPARTVHRQQIPFSVTQSGEVEELLPNHSSFPKQEPLIVREQTPPSPTVISRSRRPINHHCPCTPESRHLQLVICRSWTSIILPRFK
ncbi:hypothetical protein J6590_105118 [Homalodisca vitripennis]|nr:hypothetical protein J6590_105118 [Homalodisca vitripennis]